MLLLSNAISIDKILSSQIATSSKHWLLSHLCEHHFKSFTCLGSLDTWQQILFCCPILQGAKVSLALETVTGPFANKNSVSEPLVLQNKLQKYWLCPCDDSM